MPKGKKYRPKWRDDPRQDWARAVKRRDKVCRVCGKANYRNAHHVIPANLVPSLALDVNNGITLCHFHHVELHRAKLDIELLPLLYAAHLEGAIIHVVLQRQAAFRALADIPRVRLEAYAILRVLPRSYKKTVAERWPDFILPK